MRPQSLGKDTKVEIMSFLICSPKNMLSEVADQGSVIDISLLIKYGTLIGVQLFV